MGKERQMKILVVVGTVTMLLLLLLISPSLSRGHFLINSEQVQSPFKSITAAEDYVVVQGRWKRIAGSTTFSKPPRINSVTITCDRKEMTCEEIIAELVTPEELPGLKKPQLFIDETTYRIIDWKDGTIRATHRAFVADFELRIASKDKTAERYWRETKARGANTSDPQNFENWILE
jgi:hypothetical protein